MNTSSQRKAKESATCESDHEALAAGFAIPIDKQLEAAAEIL